MYSPKGKFGWYELMTSDTAASAAFYTSVVGWTATEMPSPDMPYTVFNAEGSGVAGMLTVPGAPTMWVGYIHGRRRGRPHPKSRRSRRRQAVEAYHRRSRRGMLRFAVMSDPQGAAIVLFTSNPAMPTPANRLLASAPLQAPSAGMSSTPPTSKRHGTSGSSQFGWTLGGL